MRALRDGLTDADEAILGTDPANPDTDGDGIVSVGEGFPFYGPVILPLAPFNLVDGDGELSYLRRRNANFKRSQATSYGATAMGRFD